MPHPGMPRRLGRKPLGRSGGLTQRAKTASHRNGGKHACWKLAVSSTKRRAKVGGRVMTRIWRARVKLPNASVQEVQVQADTYWNAKAMIEGQYGVGCILFGPATVSDPPPRMPRYGDRTPRQSRRSSMPADQVEEEYEEERPRQSGCLRIILAVAGLLVLAFVLLVILILVGTRHETPDAARLPPKETSAPTKSTPPPNRTEIEHSPDTTIAPQVTASTDISFNLDIVRLPSKYEPSAIAVVSVKNPTAVAVRTTVECSFTADDGSELDNQSRVFELEPGGSQTGEIPGKTGSVPFRVACKPR